MAKDCVVLMWATWPHLPQALRMMEAWGVDFKTGFPWLKLSKDMLPRLGTGYHARACSEPLLIGTRGNPRAPAPHERREGVLFSKVGAHSAKPDTIYEVAELYDGPFLECFARPDGGLDEPRRNWWRIGDAMDGLDISEALCRLAALPQPTLTADPEPDTLPPTQETLEL
jgi:N6-adenosine-specific RNA methylase IME4